VKENIDIIHPDEVEQFFKRIGYIEELRVENIKCDSCGDIITLYNFKGVFREKGRLFFMCNKEWCLSKLMFPCNTQELEK
jgi:hypothetical protein